MYSSSHIYDIARRVAFSFTAANYAIIYYTQICAANYVLHIDRKLVAFPNRKMSFHLAMLNMDNTCAICSLMIASSVGGLVYTVYTNSSSSDLEQHIYIYIYINSIMILQYRRRIYQIHPNFHTYRLTCQIPPYILIRRSLWNRAYIGFSRIPTNIHLMICISCKC